MAGWHFPLQKLPGPSVSSLLLCLGAAPASRWAQPNLPAFRQPGASPTFPPAAGAVPESHSPSRVRLAGLGTLTVEALLCSSPQQPAQALSDACATRLPLLPAWDVAKIAGEASRNYPSLFFVLHDQQRGFLAHGGSRRL